MHHTIGREAAVLPGAEQHRIYRRNSAQANVRTRGILRKESNAFQEKLGARKETILSRSNRPSSPVRGSPTAPVVKLILPPEWGQTVTAGAEETSSQGNQQSKAEVTATAPNTFTNGCEDNGESNTRDLQDEHLKPNINEEERRQHAEITGGGAEEEKAEASKTAQTRTILSGEEAFTSNFEDASRTGGQEVEIGQKTESGSPSESPVDVEMAEAAEETTQPEELAAAVAAGKETKAETRSCRRVLQRGRSPTARAPRSPSDRTKLQAEFRKRSQAAERKMGTTEWKAESNEARLNMVAGRAKGKGVSLRKVSLSPKRKAASHWVTDRTQDMAEDILERTDNARQAAVVRSLSTKRRPTEAARRGEKMTTQKFSHQYMQASTGNPDSEEEKHLYNRKE
ncbi:unnamed protein product [Phytophthora fragariaefolia]|uniref:Unnamed protein product n=1 Tax=Phytophthora fragariaefolia TaxID=1490495 RepID=A0A9W6TWT5_9STRA|nr:unnamed protein product [Phytophthora fragariaefolia]